MIEPLSRPSAVETRVTGAGRGVLFVSIVALLLGAAGFGAGFALAAALGFALLAVAAVAARRRVRTLRLCPPAPATATARESFVLEATVGRTGSGVSLDLTATFLDPRGVRRVAGFLPRVAAGEETDLRAVHPPLPRGLWRPHDLELESSGPLGFVRCCARFSLPRDVLVLPRLGTLRRPDEEFARWREAAPSTPRGRSEGDEFHTLRGWREGESLRRVHWKASARRGRLLVRELRGAPQRPVHVVLVAATSRRARGRLADFETAVSLAATLVEHHARRDGAVRLTVLGREVRTFALRRGKGAAVALLRELAVVESVGGSEVVGLGAVPSAARSGQRVVVVRADGIGGAAPAVRRGSPPWRVLDVTDPSIGAVFSPRRVASPAASALLRAERVDPGDPERPGKDVVVRRALSGLGVIAACAVVTAAVGVGVAGAELFAALPTGLPDLARRGALVVLLLAVAGFQTLAAARNTRDRPTLVRTLWTSQALVVIAASVVDAASAALLVPVAVTLLVAGLALAHASAVRERVLRALRGRAVFADEASTAGRRGRTGAALGLPVLALAALLFPPALHVPDLLRVEWSRMTGTSDAPRGRGGSGDGRGSGGRTLVVDPTTRGLPPEEFAHRLLLEVIPAPAARPIAAPLPLYVRGSVLAEVDELGRWLDPDVEPPTVRDGDDGWEDGWCRLGAAGSDRGEPSSVEEVLVRQVFLRHGPTDLPLLHSLPGTVGVERAAVMHEDEGALLVGSEPFSPVEYRLRILRPHRRTWPTETTPRAQRDPRFLAVPSRHPAAAALVNEAREWTAGETSDLARVRAVVRRLREDYTYERLEEVPESDDALQRLVATRRGSCFEFAQAAAVMLRSRGIPARVATGFLLRDWDAGRGDWRGFGRDAHAWVEVAFEGCGWVVFDPTPMAPAADAVEQGTAAAKSLGGSGSGKQGLEQAVRMLRDRIARTFSGVTDVTGTGGLLGLFTVVAAVAALLFLVPRRDARRLAERERYEAAAPCWARLLARLSRRGLRRGQTETALEFAARVVADEGERLAAFLPLTRLEQEARYGVRPLTSDDERAIEALRRAV